VKFPQLKSNNIFSEESSGFFPQETAILFFSFVTIMTWFLFPLFNGFIRLALYMFHRFQNHELFENKPIALFTIFHPMV